jgi:hypothetical protein
MNTTNNTSNAVLSAVLKKFFIALVWAFLVLVFFTKVISYGVLYAPLLGGNPGPPADASAAPMILALAVGLTAILHKRLYAKLIGRAASKGVKFGLAMFWALFVLVLP